MGFFSDLVSTVKDIIPVAATIGGAILGGPAGAVVGGRLAGQLGFRGTTGQGIAAAPIEQIVGPLPTIATVQPPPSFSFGRRRQRKITQSTLSAVTRQAAANQLARETERNQQMGFLDFIGKILAGPATTAPALTQQQFLPIRAQAVARASLLPDPRVPVAALPALAAPGGRGNGFFATSTIVQTLDLRTGQIVRQRVLNGSPFLMNNEVNKLRTVARKLGKANARLPRKTRKASAQRELVDAVTQNALRRVITDGSCPPG